MTRENKLALVVGFALVLLVGILISDHFSTVRSQQAAELEPPSDPLVHHTRQQDPYLIDDHVADEVVDVGAHPQITMGSPVQPAMQSGRISLPPTDTPPPASESIQRMTLDELRQRFDAQQAEQTSRASQSNDQFHQVRASETLTSICRQYYGDPNLINALARYNNITNPNSISVGHRLRIPSAEALGASPTPAANQPATIATPPQPAARYTTYTITSDDTLSDLAQRFMGTSRKWRELYELNKDVIKNPDRIVVGTKIKVPAR